MEPAIGNCKVCSGQLPILSIIHQDPYCSTKCAKEDHNVILSEHVLGKRGYSDISKAPISSSISPGHST